jgi:hypothetical protein
MRDTRRLVETSIQNLSGLWEGEPRIAREEIAKHVQKIALKPMLRTYVASGTWDWLGVPGRAATMVVPGARHGPNVCRFVSSGWPRHESETNLSGLDLGTFGRRLALGGCRVARLAGIEDWDECVYGGDQAN